MIDQGSDPTWWLSELDTASLDLLRLLAIVGVAPVPIHALTAHRHALPPALCDAFAREDPWHVLEPLRSLALLEEGSAGVSLHERVRAMVRQALARKELAHSVESAVIFLDDALPADSEHPRRRSEVDSLVDHVLATFDQVQDLQERGDFDPIGEPVVAERLVSLLDRVGRYFDSRGRYEAAHSVLGEALAICRERPIPPRLQGNVLRSLASSVRKLGESADAVRLLEEAIRIHGAIGETLELVRDHLDLATTLATSDNARALVQKALSHVDRAFALLPEDESAKLENGRAHVARGSIQIFVGGEPAEGRAELERAIELLDDVPDGHGELDAVEARATLGFGLAGLGPVERDSGRRMQENALRCTEEILGPEHPEVGVQLSNLASVDGGVGEWAQAREHLERSLEIAERLLPAEHPTRFIRHAKLAAALERQDNHQGALSHWTVAVGLGERIHPGTLELVNVLSGLARAHRHLGNHKAAQLALARALYVAEALEEQDERGLADLRFQLVDAQIRLGDISSALGALTPLLAGSMSSERTTISRLWAGHLIERLGADVARACRASGQGPAAEAVERQLHGVSRALAQDPLNSEDPAAALLAASLVMQADEVDDARRGLEHVGATIGTRDQSLLLQLVGRWKALLQKHLDRGDVEGAMTLLERALSTLPSDPAADGALQIVAADVYDFAGEYEQAIASAARAAEQLRHAGDVDGTLDALGRLAKLQPDASKRVEVLTRRVEAAAGADTEQQLTRALQDLGHGLRAQGDLDSALEADREAVRRARSTGDARTLAPALLGLARTQEARGELHEAIAAYEERLDLVRAFPSPDHFSEGVTLHDLGDVRIALGELDEAIRLYGQAVAHKRHADNAQELASSMFALARGYLQRGEDANALRIMHERSTVLESLPRRDLAAEADALVYVALIEQERSRPEEALALLRQTLELVEGLDDRSRLAHTYVQASVAALAASDDTEAAVFADRAIDIFESAPARDADGLTFSLLLRARALRRDPHAMLTALLAATSAYQRRERLIAGVAAPVARTLADVCSGLGLVELATAVEQAARSLLEEGALSEEGARDELDAIRSLLACGRLSEAREALDDAAAPDGSSSRGMDSALTAEWFQLGRCFQARGAFRDAVGAFEVALAGVESRPVHRSAQRALISCDLAESMRALGEEEAAIELFDAAASAFEKGSMREQAGVLLRWGRALYATDRYVEAIEVLRLRLKLLGQIGRDPSAEGVTWHDMGNVYRLRGLAKRAIDCYRKARAAKLAGESRVRDVAVTTLSLAYMLRRIKPAPAAELDQLAQESELLLRDAVVVAEMQSPKTLPAGLENASRRRQALNARTAQPFDALSAQAIAGLVRVGTACGRVPAAVGAEAGLVQGVAAELRQLALLEGGDARGPRLTTKGEHAVRLLWSAGEDNSTATSAGEALLGARLWLLDRDEDATRKLLDAVDEREQSIDATLARALQLCLMRAPSDRFVSRVRGELDEHLVTSEPDSFLGIAAAAIDCDDPRLARRALVSLETEPKPANEQGPGLIADLGVAWHVVAVAYEKGGEIEDSRDAYDRASGAFAQLHVDLEIAPMRHQSDMLRFARKAAAALELEHSTPFSPASAGTRVLTAVTCLRAARLQALLGRKVAARVLNWRVISCARYVSPRGGDPGSDSSHAPRPRAADRSRVQELTPSGIALLEVLRQDAYDSALRGVLPGLLFGLGSWRAAATAAEELERAALAEVQLREGWVRLTDRGARAASALVD